MLRNIIFFLLNNGTSIVYWTLAVIIVYMWFTFIKNKEYKIPKIDYGLLGKEEHKTIREYIKHMDGRGFEEFMAWVFEKSGEYETIELTPERNDGGKDIVLFSKEKGYTYVECKRYQDKTQDYEEYMIGREICSKLAGQMLADGIKKGIICTTGNVHKNAAEFLSKLELNSPDIKISIMNLDDIMTLVQNINSEEVYSQITIPS